MSLTLLIPLIIRLAGESAQNTSEAVAAVATMLEAHERKEHRLAERLLG